MRDVFDYLRQLRIVTLESFYNSRENSTVQELFMKTILLKFAGYCHNYDYGVLPVDTSDFIATHNLLCLSDMQGLHPIMGYKMITVEQAQVYGQVFPGLKLAQATGSFRHSAVIKHIMDRCERQNRTLGYLGSWTRDPAIKDNRELASALREIFKAMFYFQAKGSGIDEVVIGGTLRFKTEQLFKTMGFAALQHDGRDLATVHVPHLLKEEVLIMHLSDLNKVPLESADRWKMLWDQRLTLGPTKSAPTSAVIKKAS